MAPERRGRLDALLDAELVLEAPAARAEAVTRSAGATPNDAIGADTGLAPGTVLGKYRLERELGAGGMGVVWAARDQHLDRDVALKVLNPELGGDGVSRARMVREARAMARLVHPNVLAVFDATTIAGHDLIAMELVAGETLASWLHHRPARADVVAALLAAGRGLAIAHAAGMVHRDFKPHNVLVDRTGRVVVTDFGLVRAVGETVPAPSVSADRVAHEPPLTVTGTVMGTYEYMPPEQLAGAPADARSDQYAFCATAWEALAGVRPFATDIGTLIAGIPQQATPRAPERVPRRLRKILARGLAADPAERWPSMQALLTALERAWRRPRRILIACAAIVVATAAVAAVVVLKRPTAPPWQPRITDLPAFVENSDGIAVSPDGTTYAYASDRDQPQTFRIYLQPAAGGEPRAITPVGESYQSPRWTRDGKALLLGHWDKPNMRYEIVKRSLADGATTALGSGFHADDCGDAIAIATSDGAEARLELLHPDGQRTVLSRTTGQWILVPRCDRTGEHIVFTRGASPMLDRPVDDLFVIDRAGHEVQITGGHATANGTFTPDGRSVVFSALVGDGAISLYEVAATGGKPHRLTFDSGPHIAPEVAPDGKTLVFDRDESARVAIAGGGSATRTLSTRRETLLDIVPAADGSQIIADRVGEKGSEIVVISASDGSERVLTGGVHPFLSLDGKRVWYRPHGAPALASIALDGSATAPPIALPGELLSGIDAADGAHLVLRLGAKAESWRLTPEHRLEPEHADGQVLPAPFGGWSAVRTWSDGYRYRFVAPDGTASSLELRAENEHPTWLDAHRFAYAFGGFFHVVDVTTGAEVDKLPAPSWGQNAVLAADGTHWFDLQTIGRVTHHVMENFADRPWRF